MIHSVPNSVYICYYDHQVSLFYYLGSKGQFQKSSTLVQSSSLVIRHYHSNSHLDLLTLMILYMLHYLCLFLFSSSSFFSIWETTSRVANEVIVKSKWMPILTSTPGPTALHPLRRMWCKLQVKKKQKKPSRTHLLILLGKLIEWTPTWKSPCWQLGLEPVCSPVL